MIGARLCATIGLAALAALAAFAGAGLPPLRFATDLDHGSATVRHRVVSDVNVFVDAAGGRDEPGCGAAPGAQACATPQYAYDVTSAALDLGGHALAIDVMPGLATVAAEPYPVGATSLVLPAGHRPPFALKPGTLLSGPGFPRSTTVAGTDARGDGSLVVRLASGRASAAGTAVTFQATYPGLRITGIVPGQASAAQLLVRGWHGTAVFQPTGGGNSFGCDAGCRMTIADVKMDARFASQEGNPGQDHIGVGAYSELHIRGGVVFGDDMQPANAISAAFGGLVILDEGPIGIAVDAQTIATVPFAAGASSIAIAKDELTFPVLKLMGVTGDGVPPGTFVGSVADVGGRTVIGLANRFHPAVTTVAGASLTISYSFQTFINPGDSSQLYCATNAEPGRLTVDIAGTPFFYYAFMFAGAGHVNCGGVNWQGTINGLSIDEERGGDIYTQAGVPDMPGNIFEEETVTAAAGSNVVNVADGGKYKLGQWVNSIVRTTASFDPARDQSRDEGTGYWQATIAVGSTAGLTPGAAIAGAGLSDGYLVSAVDAGRRTVTLRYDGDVAPPLLAPKLDTPIIAVGGSIPPSTRISGIAGNALTLTAMANASGPTLIHAEGFSDKYGPAPVYGTMRPFMPTVAAAAPGRWSAPTGGCDYTQFAEHGLVVMTCSLGIAETGSVAGVGAFVSLPVPADLSHGMQGGVSGKEGASTGYGFAGQIGNPDASHAYLTYASGAGLGVPGQRLGLPLTFTYKAR